MSIVCIIQNRQTSTRLPGKCFLDLCGQSVSYRVLERVKMSKIITNIIVAIPYTKENDKLANFYKDKVTLYRGSENDLLTRYYQASKIFKSDHIVRITADCPLIDPIVIDKVIQKHLAEGNDYTSNTLEETFPDGYDVSIMKTKVLEEAYQEAKLPSVREHVVTYIINNMARYKIGELICQKGNYFDYHLSIDYQEDYQVVKTIYEALYPKNRIFGLYEVLNYINENPELLQINKHIVRNEGYYKSLEKDK